MNEASPGLWEEAYFRQQLDAAAGRLFRGLIHNLNGIVQAFSMESELFALTLPQVEKLLAQSALLPDPDRGQMIDRVRTTLESRRKVSEQMREKVEAAQNILRRTGLLTSLADGEAPGYTVADVIRTEVDFRQADMFFKHRMEKELKLSEELPLVRRRGLELHQAVFFLLANGVEALRENGREPRLIIEARREGNSIRIGVEDNGPGIPPAEQHRIFEPFFTTKAGHEGLGLFLAKKMIERCGGQVVFTTHPGSTRFDLVIPEENI